MTVLVAMPYWRTPDTVQRAVDSVLAQTHRDLRLLVIGDGEVPPLHFHGDSRLEIFTLPENRGPYFALEVALRASTDQWFAPVGSDDYLDPEHIEILLAAGASANFPGAVHLHVGDGVTAWAGSWWYVGVFATERLLAIGGHDPAQRVEQDTLMSQLLRLTGPFARTTEPTYHVVPREDSLTSSARTGFGTALRQKAIRERKAVLRQAQRLRTPDRIRAYREGLVSSDLRQELGLYSYQLRDRLEAQVA